MFRLLFGTTKPLLLSWGLCLTHALTVQAPRFALWFELLPAIFKKTLWIPVGPFCCLAQLYLSPAFRSLSASFHWSCSPSSSSCLPSFLSSTGSASTCLLDSWVWEDVQWVCWDGWNCLPDRKDKECNPPLPSQACFLRWFFRCLIPASLFHTQPSSCLMGSLPLCSF